MTRTYSQFFFEHLQFYIPPAIFGSIKFCNFNNSRKSPIKWGAKYNYCFTVYTYMGCVSLLSSLPN